jgi:hypothetical protein
MALAPDYYMLTLLPPVSPFDISTHFILHKRLSSNHPHIWLMSVPTMTTKEPLFSAMIAYAVCRSVAIKHAH